MTSATGRPLIDVACGVLVNASGEILIAQRPPGKIAAGKWEFPGGKIEPGETTEVALARELDEELGVCVRQAAPLARLRQDYSDRSVWLDTWKVPAFDGQPQPREGQQLAWVRPEAAGAYDLLPSCWRILAALLLPQHYVFTPADALIADWLPQLSALPAGALLRLRRPSLDDTSYRSEAAIAASACREQGLGLVLDREPQLVESLDVAGWHATSRALAGLAQRPLSQARWCLGSVHDTHELEQARLAGLDAAVIAPVLPTTTHPGAAVLGWRGFVDLAATAGLPLYALGGMTVQSLPEARRNGALGIAGISTYWSSSRPGGNSSAGME